MRDLCEIVCALSQPDICILISIRGFRKRSKPMMCPKCEKLKKKLYRDVNKKKLD